MEQSALGTWVSYSYGQDQAACLISKYVFSIPGRSGIMITRPDTNISDLTIVPYIANGTGCPNFHFEDILQGKGLLLGIFNKIDKTQMITQYCTYEWQAIS